MTRHNGQRLLALGVAAATALGTASALASSHREAPFITSLPKVDGTDFYMFRSYESGRGDYVTLIANYIPLQEPEGGPNYFMMDPNAVYEIHVDNNGDAVEDVTFQFKFQDVLADLKVMAGDQQVSVPLRNIGGIGPMAGETDNVNLRQTYTLSVVRGDRRTGTASTVVNMADGSDSFRKPIDNIGNKSFADYAAYSNNHIYDVTIPGCNSPGRVFVGQRQESFTANLGETFDLVNYNPLGARDSQTNTLNRYNVTSLAMEVPIACLTNGDPVVGAWTTASLRQARVLNPQPAANSGGKGPAIHGGAFTQVSRLGHPLVNEVVIGLPDKDRFNASEPKDDSQFATYVTNPSFPELLEILFADAGAVAPNMFPRTDLVAVFLTGVDGLNKPANVTASEMLRLNTGIAPVAAVSQNSLGVLGGDTAGFPNGRRPGDDVVDIVLRAAMGALIEDQTVAPNNTAPFTDGAIVDATMYRTAFPYLNTAIPGSPSTANAGFDEAVQ
jgi:hypothetical protein